MKIFVLAIFSILLLGCAQNSSTQNAATQPSDRELQATASIVSDGASALNESGEGASRVDRGEITPTDRENMAANSGTGQNIGVENPFQRVQYDVAGSASLIQRDGKTFVSFSKEFSTKSGPKLVVLLSKTPTPNSNAVLDSFESVKIGDLVDVKGYQEYELPDGFQDFKSVLVFCEPFRVIWGYAPIQ